MKISIVIPNYNGATLLKKNLPLVLSSMQGFEKKNIELIVVDDVSTDSSKEFLEEFSKTRKDLKIVILENKVNLGFSPTVNRGVHNASGDLILLLNSDVIPEKGFYLPLLPHFKNKEIFAVGCMDKSIENGEIILRGRGEGEWKRGVLIHKRGEVNKDTTLWVSGGSSIFRKEIWELLGGFNELFSPFYWEDIDLSYRAIKSGYSIRFEQKSVVVHEHESGAIKKTFSPSYIKTIAYRNQFIFVWCNLTDKHLIIFHILWLPYHILSSLLRLDIPFLLGLLKAIKMFPKIVVKRRENKKLFTKSDMAVIREVGKT